ncbi:hypothetical protein [Halosimplex sp. J119]
MTDDPLREVVRRLRRQSRDLERLKGANARDGAVNILRRVTGTAEADDTVTTTVESSGGFQWDQGSWDQDRWEP